MKARYAESLVPTSTTTTDRERTYPWRKTRRNHARFKRPKSARSRHYPRSADCITATNDKQLEITGAYSRFLVDRSVCICPHVLRICSQAGYSNRPPHSSHGGPVRTPHGVFVRDSEGLAEREKEMLREAEMRVLDVAVACGFKTQQHFARVFRRICGASPTEYRYEVLR